MYDIYTGVLYNINYAHYLYIDSFLFFHNKLFFEAFIKKYTYYNSCRWLVTFYIINIAN